jgi:pimeloyl-ACP methyl ester carboxylesterase
MSIRKSAAFSLAALVAIVAAAAIFAWAPDQPSSNLRARWAPPPSVFISVQGMDVHLRDEGPRDDPDPIVLLHGTSASLHTWEGWAAALKTSRRVIRFDMPGFGLTGPAPDGDYTIGRYARFVLAMMDALGVRRCVIGGNSFGGHVAWVTALAAPDRADKLILVDAGGYPLKSTSVPIGFRIARTPLVNNLIPFFLPRAVIEQSLRDVYGDPEKVTPDLVDLYFAMAVRAGNRRALIERFAQIPLEGTGDHVKELRLPTLILWGGRDRLIDPSNAQRFRQDIPGSELIVFDDLGHVPHEEAPEKTVAAVRQFVDH